ncbi:MAG: hypothetical protein KYX62_17275 [Pseudomonadota bacterium]|nr:hypothetical protein [Pseudomonadota bacterium]
MKEDLKLNTYGEVDVEYYVQQAHAERNKAVARLFTGAVSAIASALHVKPHFAKSHKMAGSH